MVRLFLSWAIGAVAIGDKVTVRFYGESKCPNCRDFVNDVLPKMTGDAQLMAAVDFDYVPWGNAY